MYLFAQCQYHIAKFAVFFSLPSSHSYFSFFFDDCRCSCTPNSHFLMRSQQWILWTNSKFNGNLIFGTFVVVDLSTAILHTNTYTHNLFLSRSLDLDLLLYFRNNASCFFCFFFRIFPFLFLHTCSCNASAWIVLLYIYLFYFYTTCTTVHFENECFNLKSMVV